MLTCLDLFSGIGGFSLGLERTGGFKTVAFCEIEPFCRAVLAKNWPSVPCHEDVRMLGGAQYRGQVDVVTGGVPCQPASVAGKRKGSSDERWLWPDFLRVVREVEPLWVLAENPRGIVSLKPHGLAWIERELLAAGYETQCFCIGADDVGAPHQRKRVWIVAHRGEQAGRRIGHGWREQQPESGEETQCVAHCDSWRCRAPIGNDDAGEPDTSRSSSELAHNPRHWQSGQPEAERTNGLRIGTGGDEGLADAAIGGQRTDGSASGDAGHADIGRENLADSEHEGRGRRESKDGERKDAGSGCLCREAYRWPARPGEPQHEWEAPRLVLGRRCWNLWRDFCSRSSPVDTREWYEETAWKFKRGLGLSVDGPPSRLARFANKQGLRACGNAIVPQVAEVIGRAILAGHSTPTIRSDE